MRIELIGDGGVRISLDVGEPEHADAETRSDAQWLRCRVKAAMPHFDGSIPLSVLVGDLAALRTRIESLLAGRSSTFEYSATEGGLLLRAAVGRTGRIDLLCEIVDVDRRSALRFHIDVDREALGQFEDGLRRAVDLRHDGGT